MKSNKTKLIEELKHRILTLDLEPGEDLDEVVLGKQYGLSRTPVREIFLRLAGDGYIDIRKNKGARVAPMDYSTLRNFFLVAPMIYASIGRLAVRNFKPVQLDNLKAAQERFREAGRTGDALAMVLENNRFHEIMGEMSGNVYLQASLSRLLIDHARIGHTFFQPSNDDMKQRLELAIEHHDAFIEAIAARDEATVVDLVSEHWDLSRENMELFIAPKGLESHSFDERANAMSMENATDV